MLKSSRILLATTAFVATTSAASAVTVSTSVATSYTTDVSGPVTITTTGNITTTSASSPITVSGTTLASNTVANSGIISTANASGTIVGDADAANYSITNNSGASLLNTGTGPAIDLSNVTGTNTITNAGTISGSVSVSGTTSITNSGTINGNVTGHGATNYTQSAGLLNGNFSTAGSTVSGTFSLSGGTVSGSVNLGDGADVIGISGGTITGTLDTGFGDDVITYTGGTLRAINASNGNDTLNISGTTTTFTTGGTITAVENINVSGTANLNHAVTGLTNLRVGSGATVNANQSFNTTSGGALYVSGTMNIAAGKVVSTSNVFNTGVVGFAVSDSTSAGRIDIDDAAGTYAGTGQIAINFGDNSGYIASGTTFKIVSSTGVAATLPSLTTTTNGLYTYQLALAGGSNQDISLTILRKDTASVVTSEAGKGIAGVIETVSGSATGDLKTINSVINQQSNAAGINNVIESLTPSLDTGAAMASVDFGGAVNTNTSTRLASLRGSALSGVATGDASLQNRFWVKGFGNVTEQDDNKGNRGYDASTAGASFGVDSDAVIDGYTAGMGFSYGKTKVESNASSNAETDVDSYMASLYGSKVYGDGMFVNGMINLGYNKYDMQRQAIGFTGKTSGDTDGLQGGLKLEVGRDYALGSTLFTPLAGLQYTYLKMDEYTEKGPTAQKVDPDAMSTVDASLGLQIAHDIAMENGATLRPAVRAKYVYRMGDNNLEGSSQFLAGGGAFTTQGVEADRSSVNLGAGVTILSAGGLDMGLDYDADIRSNLTGHTGQVKVRWVF